MRAPTPRAHRLVADGGGDTRTRSQAQDRNGAPRQYAFDVGFFDWEDRVAVYADDVQVSVANLPTAVPPVSLPAWLNGTLAVAGVLAAIERALTLRSCWLLDADTYWID